MILSFLFIEMQEDRENTSIKVKILISGFFILILPFDDFTGVALSFETNDTLWIYYMETYIPRRDICFSLAEGVTRYVESAGVDSKRSQNGLKMGGGVIP